MELNDRNILNVLHDAEFADAHWELLGEQLIKHSALLNIRANCHGDSNLCIIDTISQWLRTDTEPSWEKLAEAVAKVEQYGEATADSVREKAGIGMFCLHVFCLNLQYHQLSMIPPNCTDKIFAFYKLLKAYTVVVDKVKWLGEIQFAQLIS